MDHIKLAAICPFRGVLCKMNDGEGTGGLRVRLDLSHSYRRFAPYNLKSFVRQVLTQTSPFLSNILTLCHRDAIRARKRAKVRIAVHRGESRVGPNRPPRKTACSLRPSAAVEHVGATHQALVPCCPHARIGEGGIISIANSVDGTKEYVLFDCSRPEADHVVRPATFVTNLRRGNARVSR